MENIYERQSKKTLQTTESRLDKEVTPKNKQHILNFIKKMKNERKSSGRIAMLIVACIKYDNFFTEAEVERVREGKRLKCVVKSRKQPKKDFKSLTRTDIEKYCEYLNNKEMQESRRFGLKNDLKQLFRYIYNMEDQDEFPEQVSWIKKKQLLEKKKFRKKTRAELPTEDDIITLLQHTIDDQDKAMFSLFFETGLRPKELLMLQIRNITIQEDIVEVEIPLETKTGDVHKPVLCIASKPSMIEWLNKHPFRTEPNSWLFINKRKNNIDQISYGAFRRRFNQLLKKSGLSKHLTLYHFRHASYTRKADEGWNDSDIKTHHGLIQSSRVLDTYLHRSNDSIRQKLKETHNLPFEKKINETLIKIQKCHKCNEENSITDTNCSNCGALINLKHVEERERLAREERERLAKEEQEDRDKGIRDEIKELKNFTKYLAEELLLHKIGFEDRRVPLPNPKQIIKESKIEYEMSKNQF